MKTSTSVLRLRLDRVPDPVAAYIALCENGTHPGTAMLESAAPGHGGSQRTLLALAPALRVALDVNGISITAATANGRSLLKSLGTDAEHDVLRLPFPPRKGSHALDERSRLQEACVFDPLREILRAARPARAVDSDRVMLVGATGFEIVERFVPLPALSDNALPGYVFALPELLLEIDHGSQRAELAAVAFDEHSRNDLSQTLERVARQLESLAEAGEIPAGTIGKEPKESRSDAAFCRDVEKGRDAVRNGDVFQVVLSRHWTLPCTDPFAAYRRLRRDNPSPCLFYLCDNEMTLFGASPEIALAFDAASRDVELYPIAGTRARGRNADDDARIEAGLRLDAKELAEHMMLVDLARNDIASICEPGTREVPVLLGVDRYRHVMHLVSRVRGKLRSGLDALHGLRACLNMGTLSGAPKMRASELIREIEQERRGFYGGTVGRLDAAGNLDTAITIRAATVRDGMARVQAGAGVVLDSEPQAEADETRRKAQAVLNAIANPEVRQCNVA